MLPVLVFDLLIENFVCDFLILFLREQLNANQATEETAAWGAQTETAEPQPAPEGYVGSVFTFISKCC